LGDQRTQRSFVGHIHAGEPTFWAFGVMDVGDPHVHALRQQAQCDRSPDPFGGAGHQRDF
jgi:hypothetical protein